MNYQLILYKFRAYIIIKYKVVVYVFGWILLNIGKEIKSDDGENLLSLFLLSKDC